LLEIEFQCELYLSRRALEQRWATGTRNSPRARGPDLRIGIIELRRIEHVESFGTELQPSELTAAKIESLEN